VKSKAHQSSTIYASLKANLVREKSLKTQWFACRHA